MSLSRFNINLARFTRHDEGVIALQKIEVSFQSLGVLILGCVLTSSNYAVSFTKFRLIFHTTQPTNRFTKFHPIQGSITTQVRGLQTNW